MNSELDIKTNVAIEAAIGSGMGDCLWARKLSHFVTSHPGQLSLPSLLGFVNEYQLQLARQRQVWLIPVADERVGAQVKLRCVEITCHT